jgi:hypothetical protein
MSDENPITFPAIARCAFKEGGKLYDYIAPFPVLVGQRVWIDGRYGKTKLIVGEVIQESEKATASLIGIVEEEQENADE